MPLAKPREQDATSAIVWTAALCVAATLPLLPVALEFARLGIPDILFTGDGASLELGTLHAARGAQLVGPYSRFGWNHPGPTFFYLAAPLYELLHRRGPALNLFALLSNASVALAMVFTARQMRGPVFGVAMAALLAIYTLVGLPFLITNEWNPIIPILPLALLLLLAVRLSLGARHLVPVYVFLASAIVQTHIGFLLPVVGASIVVLLSDRIVRNRALTMPAQRMTQWPVVLMYVVLALCWTLPIWEALTHRGGNIWLIARFFVPKHWSQHAWSEAAAIVLDQLVTMPLAVLRTFRPALTLSSTVASRLLASGQIALVIVALWSARRRQDTSLMVLATIILIEIPFRRRGPSYSR
jgi:hypothetical protein